MGNLDSKTAGGMNCCCSSISDASTTGRALTVLNPRMDHCASWKCVLTAIACQTAWKRPGYSNISSTAWKRSTTEHFAWTPTCNCMFASPAANFTARIPKLNPNHRDWHSDYYLTLDSGLWSQPEPHHDGDSGRHQTVLPGQVLGASACGMTVRCCCKQFDWSSFLL